MNIDDLTPLLAQNQVVNFSTYRRDGRQQMSLVTVGRVGDALAFTTRQRNAKYANLLRDPRCAMMVMSPDLRVYAVLDGDAQVVGAHNSDADTLRATLRDVYRASAGKEHPNWDEYDAVMAEQKRVAILLAPTRMYAHGL
ncbi:MAG: TIGR03618 family F420-dependent PPOX class oxidoreductase [Chloroflexi bacterium]|nr:TIGR03618 family F420-dependent PPOX class oxidoreductase [Chloroflexota bacterium]MDA1174424.1 TIGR03618 family F420-dependent PPOX class oxidoreductase [Chloroflexota bacterium]